MKIMKIMKNVKIVPLISVFLISFIFLALFFPRSLFALEIKLEKEPKVVKPKVDLKTPVVLDARPAFEYSMQHGVFSIPIRWQDFSQTEPPHLGELDPDVGFLARRLRILGIFPSRETIIIGNGVKGHGEEGRLAWMLNYLGLNKVRLLNYENDKAKKVSGTQPEIDAAPIWLPKVKESLKVRVQDLEKQVINKDFEKGKGALLIDVRDSKEFKTSHIPQAINIPWALFYGSHGDVLSHEDLDKLLSPYRITKQTRLVYYSDDGVSSGLTTFISTQSGYDCGNFDGGFKNWSSDQKRAHE
jgi:thiosulfate/3-mercaptopyruvate sulfurtransferase